MAHSVIFAGLDVHAAQTSAAQLEATTGELSTTRLAGGSEPAIAWLRRLGPGVRAVYEAGPTGFGLARAARDAGIRSAGGHPRVGAQAADGSGQDRPA